MHRPADSQQGFEILFLSLCSWTYQISKLDQICISDFSFICLATCFDIISKTLFKASPHIISSHARARNGVYFNMERSISPTLLASNGVFGSNRRCNFILKYLDLKKCSKYKIQYRISPTCTLIHMRSENLHRTFLPTDRDLQLSQAENESCELKWNYHLLHRLQLCF